MATYTPKVGDRVLVDTHPQVYVVIGLRDDNNIMLGFEMPGPDLAMQVDVSRIRKLGREYDPKVLERAARRRKHAIADLQEEDAACVCAYPVVNFRNVHGHDSKCPAYALLAARREARVAAREDLDP